jgi:cytochrome P450
MSDLDSLPLPPGSMGLPLLGQTLDMVKNPYEFLESRRKRYGNVFRSSVLGRKVVFVSGPEAMSAFLDTANITRERAHPSHVRDLFGGINMNMFDGPRHRALKAMALAGFDLAAIDTYLPDMRTHVRATLARLAGEGAFRAVDAFKAMSIELICKNVMSLDRGPVTEAITRDYDKVMTGMINLPIPLPGTKFSAARAARDRIFTVFREQIALHRARPHDDGLGRILAARSGDKTYTDDEALLELHHVIIAGFIVYGLLTELLQRLDADPALRAQLTDEVRGLDDAADVARLSGLRRAGHAVLEAKRRAPILPLVFGKAARTFALGAYRIPEGWDVYLALSLSNMDPALFREPDRFDVDRYGDARAEHGKHEHAFVPQGGGPPTGHKCLGADYSTFVALVFLAELLPRYTWSFPPQDLERVWNMTPPEQRDGLRVTLRRL